INNLYSEFCVLSTKNANDVMVITRKMFYQCLGKYGGARSVMAKRLFAYYDADKDNEITFKEMAQGFSVYNKGTLEDKAPYVFRAYDVDGDGRISRDDMRAMLEAFSEASRKLTNMLIQSTNAEAIGNPYELMADQPLTGAFSASVPDDTPSGPRKEPPVMRSNLTSVRSSATPTCRAAEVPIRTQDQNSASSDSEGEPSDTSSNAVSVAATTSATIGTVASARLTRHRQASNAAAAPEASQSSATASDSASPELEPIDGIGTLLRGRQEHSDAVVAVQLPSTLPSNKIVHPNKAPPWPSIPIHEEPMVVSQPKKNDANALLPCTMWHDPSVDQKWPILEALNQDAIRMMADEVFSEANPKDPFFMTYDELLAYLRRNSNLVAYVEVLGSIF
ncbi:hypothetical protein GGI22_003177, partial [Coemansia erecta]